MADQDLKIKIKSEYQNAGLDELKKALKENTVAMDEMKRSGQQGTAAWNEAKTRAQALTESIKETSREYKGLDASVKASKFQLLEYGENLTVVIAGIKAAIDGLVNFGKEMYASALEGAQVENLKKHFEDLNGGIENSNAVLQQFRQATSGKLNEEDLIKYSNKMQDLGYSTNQTTQFLDLSETASRNLGVSIEEGSNKILTFIETGRGKGLKDLGISISDVKQEMDNLAKSQGVDLKNLDDETTKRLRSDAVLKLYGKSVDEIQKKEIDHAGSIASISVAFENAKYKIGEFISGAFTVLANIFGTSAEKVAIFITVLGGLVAALVTVVTTIKLLSVAFAALNVSTGGIMIALGALVTIAAAVALSFSNTTTNIKEAREEMLKSQAVDESTKKVLEELGVSANNMAEAYKGIETSIYGMSEAQTKTAKKFVEAEIIKITALQEEAKQMQYNRVMNLGDISTQEAENRAAMFSTGWNEAQGYTANIEKLKALNSQLDSKLSMFAGQEPEDNAKSKGRIANIKEEKEQLDEIQKLQEEIKNLESERVTLVSRYGEHAEIVFNIEEKIYENKKKILELEREHNSWAKPVSLEVGVYEKNPSTERGPVDVDETIKKEQASKEFEIRKEKIKKANEEISQSMAETTTAVGNLFGAFLKGDNAKDAFKQFLKSIVNTFVTSIQAMLLASTAAANAKAITSFGITLIKDFPLIAAGWAALELAKGVIGALAQGGDFGPGAYLVGERGPELMLTGSGGYMVNNRDFNNMVMAGKQQSQSVNNILNFGIDVDWIKVRQSTDMRFTKYKNSGRL